MRRYYGPADKLFNITLAEYIKAEVFYTNYLKNNDEEQLNKLIAVLYRKRKLFISKKSETYRGDLRRKFNDHLVSLHAKKLNKLPAEVKTAIAIYYEGCRAFLHKQFPGVFKSSGTGRQSGVDGMLALVDALTGGDVTKTENVRSSYLYDVMVHLQKAIEAAEEAKEKMKQKTK